MHVLLILNLSTWKYKRSIDILKESKQLIPVFNVYETY